MSKEEILESVMNRTGSILFSNARQTALIAMEEYSDSRVKELEGKVNKLSREWLSMEGNLLEKDFEIERLKELEGEVSRLKGLLKAAHYAGWYNGMVNAYKHDFSWQQFKSENQL